MPAIRERYSAAVIVILSHFILAYRVVSHVNHPVTGFLLLLGLHPSAQPSAAPFESVARLS